MRKRKYGLLMDLFEYEKILELLSRILMVIGIMMYVATTSWLGGLSYSNINMGKFTLYTLTCVIAATMSYYASRGLRSPAQYKRSARRANVNQSLYSLLVVLIIISIVYSIMCFY
ncbi:MAG: hypothetical protein QXK88_05200 [Desulfurococcaceae archaeon]